MAEGSIRIIVLNLQGQPFDGAVDVRVMRPGDAGHPIELKAQDASKEIVVKGVEAGVTYELAVTPTGTSHAFTQGVTIPATGAAVVRLAIDRSGPMRPQPTHTLRGTLVLDHGLPAAGVTVRLYAIGFGGKDTLLEEAATDPRGGYSFAYAPPSSGAPDVQVRALEPGGKEITVSATKFKAAPAETMNLILPSKAQPLAPEFQRLSADMDRAIGGIANLGRAKEGPARADISLVSRSTNWDARLIALAAIAVQQSAATGLDQDVLYALYRVGLPTDPALLAAVDESTVHEALAKATRAEIVSFATDRITSATAAFRDFASRTLLSQRAAGAVSSFAELLATQVPDDAQRAAFAKLFFGRRSEGKDLWAEAAALNIPEHTLDSLKLQGKLLYLTYNNGPLAQRLQQDVGSVDTLSRLADKDFHKPDTWKAALTSLAGSGGTTAVDSLIPPAYPGATMTERLTAYAGDLARRVTLTFPTQAVARMVETKELVVDSAVAPRVTTFLRTAAKAGYRLGRTPLNGFFRGPGGAVPTMDDRAKQTIKTLHRLYQVTPSTESLQAAMKLGFTSARQIASYSKTDFLNKYGYAFPKGEAEMVYGQAQTISSVTFNFYSMAKALDTSAPLYALSASGSDRDAARESLVQRFPSMEGLFGSLDFCQCEECRSVLSPAAYFVDLLDLLGHESAPNTAGNTPLDVLIGKQGGITGRRPDLGALPLTCSNTNTALPYIDLVNEILEYYIAHSNALDAGAAYDTGSATTADLIAEPEHVISSVYSMTLKQVKYPLDLPFDLWLETVRGFLGYFKISLAQMLDTMRAVDTLELFTSTPYARAGILAEALGISPSEYAIFTATDTASWFGLYGSYANEAAAIGDLKNAKTLARKLGVSYQGLTDLVKTGFLNPKLYALIYQCGRFGIDMGTAFSYTNQAGYPALTAQERTEFETLLDGITARYTGANPGSTFDARTWIGNLLPASYSSTVLVLADPNTGCDFSGTTLQYADGTVPAPLDFLKLNLFVRLCNKLGCELTSDEPAGSSDGEGGDASWSLDEIDRVLQAFFPTTNLPAWTDAGFAAAFGNSWKTALAYMAHLDDLNMRLAPTLGRRALLPLWGALPTQGENPLYAQIFLTASALNNDFAFDDPNGVFPAPPSNLSTVQQSFVAHTAVVQGALNLSGADVASILSDAGVASPAGFTLANLSICYRYSLLAQCLQLSVADLIALKTMSGLDPFHILTGNPLAVIADDVLLNHTLAFVRQVGVAQSSGFTIEDLKYLLRHQYDPVGKYQIDATARMGVVQAVSGGIRQIQAQNTVPADPSSLPESLIDQTLSGLFPATILKALFTHLTNAATYSASVSSATALTAEDFAAATEVTVSYDTVTTTQTLAYTGMLLDWRKTEIAALNTNPALNGVLNGLLTSAQQQARTALATSIADVLGVWASLMQYEAVATAVSPPQAIADPLRRLTQADPSLAFTYDPSDQIQWLGYRGVLTEAKRLALTVINGSATLASLLGDVQQQALPSYNEMTGSMLAMWCNALTYKGAQGGVSAAARIDPTVFSEALAQAQQNGTITDPVPALQFAYDAAAQVQTLVCAGVLTDAMRVQLAGLITAPPATVALLGNLLQQVRNQAVGQFQGLETGLLAPALNDPDTFVAPFVGAVAAQQQKFVKAELVRVFLPLRVQKLSRQLVLQTLGAALAADPSLLEALVTDAALLNDPSSPGRSLLQTFLAAGRQGVSASYFDASGARLAGGVAKTTDTSDATNSVPGAVSSHLEGYLQVTTDGPYRFFAQLGNAGAQAALRIDSPSPTVLFANPIIQVTAAADGDEASQFVELKGGVAYQFTLDFLNVGVGGARLLVQGETLPKGALSQLVLYPAETADAFARARTLVGKVLQILAVTGLDQRELSYVVSNAPQFNNLRLSALPTQASDDSPAKATALFSQFLTLADYADLRKGPAGGTDGLVDVFQAATTTPGLAVSYYPTSDETGTPHASGIAATADTADPTNSVAGTESSRFEGYFVVPADGSYDFFAELGRAGAKVTFRVEAPRGSTSLALPVVLQHTAAADGEETHQAVTLTAGVPYHLTLDFQTLNAGVASLLVQTASLPKGPLNRLVLYPVSQLPPWIVLANLTRRDPQVVHDVADALGPDPHFSNNVGIRRMWDALQLVQILRLPVQALTASTAIATPTPASPDVIAGDLRNAVKAQYTADQWRPIAQSVYDPLRQKKRDALVSYLVETIGLDSVNQLFEYFLVDPGMEPVVQTSRLRLGLSSIQTFIQRCFLNLENGNSNAALNVVASAIPADWWPWMKRYRVWEVNRKIFLFPENWMEPELRLDKTDLFQALEGALLQGDVTRELAEDAFSEYLKGLDLRARLDIVASYLDQDAVNPGESALYVLGRTYTVPHKYFFRIYKNGTWGGWEAVPIDIEGDHIVLAMWRGRLNIFWVTFTAGADSSNASSGTPGEVGKLPFDTLLSSIAVSHAAQHAKLQLHWSEYVKGKWTNRISSDPKNVKTIWVGADFEPNRDVYVHVAKETDAAGNEGAISVLLDMYNYESAYGFRVTSKNADPAFGTQYAKLAGAVVYNVFDINATRFTGSASLESYFETALHTDGSGTWETEHILDSVNQYELLTPGNPVVPPFLPASDPGYAEAGSLVSPFFFKDGGNPNFASQARFQDDRTFFVQPSLTETVVSEWQGWAIGPSRAGQLEVDPHLIDKVKVVPQVPVGPMPPDPGDPFYSVFPMQERTDWVTNPAVAVSYEGVAIGKTGGIAKRDGKGLAVVGGHGVDSTHLQPSSLAGRATVVTV
jgi:Neuraminidase-like domain/Salmonella virulence plasmid 28.1kDa A protein